MEAKATVFDIKRFAVHDGDGIRTTVFFKGCPLKCIWCHNPEGISFKPQTALYTNKCINCMKCKSVCACHGFKNNIHTLNFNNCNGCGKCEEICLSDAIKTYGKIYTVKTLMPLLLNDIDFYENGGGITLSGGECLCQADFCKELLYECKKHNLNTAVDTSGYVPFENFEKVLPYTDTFLYDIKAFDEDVHIKCTGVSNRLILDNLKKIDALGAKTEIRIPYVPNYNDIQIEKIADFVNLLKNVKKVRVLPYHNYASGKYAALGIKNTLPETMPNKTETQKANKLFKVNNP